MFSSWISSTSIMGKTGDESEWIRLRLRNQGKINTLKERISSCDQYLCFSKTEYHLNNTTYVNTNRKSLRP